MWLSVGFVFGVLVGVILAYGARLVDSKVEQRFEQIKRTGGFKRPSPTIIDGTDKVQDFIDQHFDYERSDQALSDMPDR